MKRPSQLYADLLHGRQSQIKALAATLRSAAASDGGLPAEGFHDASGTWPTAQALANLLWIGALTPADPFCLRLRDWLVAHQNDDGGWPFRQKGESFVDTTAWSLWGLSYYPTDAGTAFQRGLRWLLDARRDEHGPGLGGWGVHPRERDRVYSTVVTLLVLQQLLERSALLAEPSRAEVQAAITEALQWLRENRNQDGGWGIHAGHPTDVANTIHGLLALLAVGGVDPVTEVQPFRIVREARLSSGTWPTVTEIFELRSGFDLRLSWFTTPYALWVESLGVRAGVVAHEEIVSACDAATAHLVDGRVSLTTDGRDQRTWAICDYLLGQHALIRIFQESRDRFAAVLAKRQDDNAIARRARTIALVRERFPFTVASLVNAYSKAGGSPAQRLSLLLLAFEGLIRYLGAVACAIYIGSRVEDPDVDKRLQQGLARPALGTWWSLLLAITRWNAATAAPASFLERLRDEVLSRRIAGETLQQECERIITLRNRTKGHGAMDVLSDHDCEQKLALADTALFEILSALEFIADYDSFFIIDSSFDELEGIEEYRIRSCKGTDALFHERVIRTTQRLARGHADPQVRYFYFQDRDADKAVNLYPFLVFQRCPDCNRETVLTYGSCQDGSVEYVAYQCGHVSQHETPDLLRRRLARWLS